MTTPADPRWAEERPYRNMNPMDLRPRNAQPPWPHTVALDNHPMGPFTIFDNEVSGWAAGGLWLLMAHDQWRLNTVETMIKTFAPWVENNVDAYVATVRKDLGIGPNAIVNPHDRATRKSLSHAMAHVEDYKIVWENEGLESGLDMTDALWPEFLEAYLAGQRATPRSPVHTSLTLAKPSGAGGSSSPGGNSVSVADAETDILNQQQLDRDKTT